MEVWCVISFYHVGRGPESRMSNTIYVEQPLPAGWFRATSSDDTFFYYNLNVLYDFVVYHVIHSPCADRVYV